jgi:hypothetical protein
LIFAWLVAGTVYFYDTYRDQKLIFITKNSIDLYQTQETSGGGAKIGIVNPTDKVKVLRVLILKDHLVIQVYVNNRQTGWVIKTSDIDLK